MKPQSPSARNFRQLLGLALIGFGLWLAAIGWLPLSAHAAPGELGTATRKKLARMQAQLNLTTELVDQMRPILENQAAQRRGVLEKYQSRDRSRMRAEMQAVRKETESGLATVLTWHRRIR